MEMLKKSRILFLLHLPPPVHGSSIVGLSIKESIEINRTYECLYINLLASQNIAESGKINFRKIVGFGLTFSNFFWSIIRKRPQLCYLALTTTGAAFFRDVLLVVLLKFFQIKRIYHLHNKGVSLYQDKIIYRICYRYIFKNADVIILSKYLYSDLAKFVNKSRISICPNGIPHIQSKNLKLSKEAGNPKSKKKGINILFLSNLIESKGVFILLEAIALLAQKKILFNAIFIGGEGDITASEFHERVSQLGITNQVIYLGKKFGVEKKQAFYDADIFVFPTYYPNECFPLVLLEAMNYSLPVISTFEGGISDIIEDGITGFILPQKDLVLLTEKLELLITNPTLRRQLGDAGRRKYEKEFTVELFEKRLIELLKKSIMRTIK